MEENENIIFKLLRDNAKKLGITPTQMAEILKRKFIPENTAFTSLEMNGAGVNSAEALLALLLNKTNSNGGTRFKKSSIDDDTIDIEDDEDSKETGRSLKF